MTRMKRALAIVAALLAPLLLAACTSALMSRATAPPAASPAPLLKLSPASLGKELAQQQQITVHAKGQTHRIDVLLEADAQAVRLAVIAMGQTAARLEWDGTSLTESRAAWWPAAIEGPRILSDLQLMLWPVQAINAALPPGWALREEGSTRTLTEQGQPVAVIVRSTPLHAELEHLRQGYRIEVDSRSLGVTP